MKKIILMLTLLVSTVVFTSCTQNERARKFGGNMTIKLERGQKLMMATWKEDDLFYLVEPMEDDYVPKTKTLYEDSSFGVLQTRVDFIESR